MKTTYVLAATLAASLPFFAANLAAQTEEEKPTEEIVVDEEIVVSANRYETPISQVGSSVTVIGLEEIGQRNQIFVQDYLRTIPGADMTQTGGPGKTSSLLIRGGSSAQTLVLIDGVRVNSLTTGGFNFANLTADNIERIEVLRGPQATLAPQAPRTRPGDRPAASRLHRRPFAPAPAPGRHHPPGQPTRSPAERAARAIGCRVRPRTNRRRGARPCAR